jgi:hypothetical protein
MVVDEISTWRSMPNLHFTVDEVEEFAVSKHDAIPAATVAPKVFAALPAVPKLSKHLVAYLAGQAYVSPYIGGTADPRIQGIGEAHAEGVLEFLGRTTQEVYTGFLQRKFAEWYRDAPKSDRHAPDEEADDDDDAGGEGGGDGGGGGGRAPTTSMPALD